MSGWPWPLNGVQSWFESFWNWISTAAVNAVSAVSGWIWSAIYWVRDRISESVTWVYNQLSSSISWIVSRLSDFGSFVANAVVSGINVVSSWIWSAVSWLRNQVSSIVSSVSGWISAAQQWIADNIWSKVLWLKDQISSSLSWISTTLTNIANDIGSWLNTQLGNVWNQITSAISSGVTWVRDSIVTAFDGAVAGIQNLVSGALTGVAAALGEGLKKTMEWLFSGLKWAAETVINFVKGAISFFQDTFVPIITDVVNRVRNALIPASPPEDLNEAFIGLGKEWQDRVLKEIEKHAASPITPQAALSVATGIAGISCGVTGLALSLGAVGSIEIMGTKIEISEIVRVMLGYLGIQHTIAPIVTVPYEVGVLRPLRQWFESVYQTNIPGPGDLVRFAVREAWRPELQLGTPDFFINYMKNLGYSEMWSKYFWAAHWIIPTYEQAREAYWRGILSATEFADLRKYADLAPAYDNVWEGLQYDLPGRIDIRWLNEWGLINREQFIRLLKSTGMNPEWIEKIADAYDRNQLRDELNRIRTNLVTIFKEGLFSEATLREELKKLGFRQDVIDLTVQDAKWDADLAEKRDYIKTYVEAFRKGKINENQLIGYLQELKVEQWKIKVILDYERARIKVAG